MAYVSRPKQGMSSIDSDSVGGGLVPWGNGVDGDGGDGRDGRDGGRDGGDGKEQLRPLMQRSERSGNGQANSFVLALVQSEVCEQMKAQTSSIPLPICSRMVPEMKLLYTFLRSCAAA